MKMNAHRVRAGNACLPALLGCNQNAEAWQGERDGIGGGEGAEMGWSRAKLALLVLLTCGSSLGLALLHAPILRPVWYPARPWAAAAPAPVADAILGSMRGRGWQPRRCCALSAQQQQKDDNPVLDAMISVINTGVSALGGSIDYRGADERAGDAPPPAEDDDEEKEEVLVDQPDEASQQLLDAFARLQMLMTSGEQLTAENSRELQSLHLLAVSELVTKAKDSRPFLSVQVLTLPAAHVAGLRFIHAVRAASSGALSSSLKWIPKKLGLTSLTSRLAADATDTGPTFTNDRDLAAMCRDIERAVSETIAIAGTCAMMEHVHSRVDFLATVRPILEHTPTKFRHQALLALASYFRTTAADGGVLQRPLPAISAAWETHFEAENRGPQRLSCATWPARAALPFLLVAARRDALATIRKKTQTLERTGAEAAALAAVDMADAACVRVVRGLLEADTSGYTLASIVRWAAEHAVDGHMDITAAMPADRQKMKTALALKMALIAGDAAEGGWDTSLYPAALKASVVADLVAFSGSTVVTDSMSAEAYSVCARAITSLQVRGFACKSDTMCDDAIGIANAMDGNL